MRLMQAHYADVIPLAVVKKEQARISADLSKVYVEDEGGTRTEQTQPFSLLLDPQVQASVLTLAKTAKNTAQKRREAKPP